MINNIQRQFHLIPKCPQESGAHASARVVAEPAEGLRAEIAQIAAIELTRQIFRWVEFRRVRRQQLDLDLALAFLHESAGRLTPVHRPPAPDAPSLHCAMPTIALPLQPAGLRR